MSSLLRSEALFGPGLPNTLDLTAILGKCMLMLVPGGCIILAAPLFVKEAVASDRRMPLILFPRVKMGCGLFLVLVQATSVAFRYNSEQFSWNLAEAAYTMSLAASLSTLAIIFASCAQSLPIPSFLNVFLLLTALFDVALTGSGFSSDLSQISLVLQTGVVLLKLLFGALEERPEQDLHHVQWWVKSSPSPASATGARGCFRFRWLNSLVIIVFNNRFNLDDLPGISQDMSSERLSGRFRCHWSQGISQLS